MYDIVIKFFIVGVFIFSLIGCQSTSQPVLIENTPYDQPVKSTPTQEKENNVINTVTMETPTPKLDGENYQQGENVEDDTTQIISQVRGQISDGVGSYFLIQFKTTLSNELHKELIEADIILYDPIENNIYQAYIPTKSLTYLETLVNHNKIITILTIPPEDKIKRPLNDPTQINSQQSYQVIVQFFDVPTITEKNKLEKMMIVDGYAEGVMSFAKGEVLGKDILLIAQLPFVKLIEKVVKNTGGGGS